MTLNNRVGLILTLVIFVGVCWCMPYIMPVGYSVPLAMVLGYPFGAWFFWKWMENE